MLARAVQGATHTIVGIAWKDLNGEPVDLTDGVLSGIIEDKDHARRDIEGLLTIITADEGRFTWKYAPEDVEVAGVFQVQFKAVYDGDEEDYELSLVHKWVVERALTLA